MRKLTAGLVAALALLGATAAQGVVIVDPDDFPANLRTHEDNRTETVLPGVTLQAIQGVTQQWSPDGEVLSLLDPVQDGDREGNRVFGWHDPGLNQPFKAKWGSKQVYFAAIFDEPVPRVSIDFLGEDAYDEGYFMAFGQNAFPNWPSLGTNVYTFDDLLLNSELLGSVFVTLNGPEDRQTAVISRPQEDIYFVLASGYFDCDTASHDVILDKFTHGHVPEPSTLAIFAAGLFLMLGFRRFRKRTG